MSYFLDQSRISKKTTGSILCIIFKNTPIARSPKFIFFFINVLYIFPLAWQKGMPVYFGNAVLLDGVLTHEVTADTTTGKVSNDSGMVIATTSIDAPCFVLRTL